MSWSNWSGLEHATPSQVTAPSSAEEIAAQVVAARAAGGTVKFAGTGHSFTGIANPGHGVQLLPSALSGITAVDREAMTVTAYAGMRLADLNAALTGLGLSLHNMGDIAEQTLAGAVSTGTHGTGGVAGLAAQLAGFTLVTGTGEILACSPETNADVFDLARVGLGALGILVTVTFRVEPLFALEAVEQPMSWKEFHASFDGLVAGADHVDAYWFPHTDRLLTKRNSRLVSLDETRPLSRTKAWFDDDFLQNTAFGALTTAANLVPGVIPRMNRMCASLLSARTYSDVAHRVFTTQRRVVFREMEYAVPRADGLAVLRECRRVLEHSDLRISFPVEIRVAPADDVALSTAYRRDSLYLAFHTHRAAEHRAYFALIEPVLRAAEGRPHWGKLHTLDSTALAASYPRFTDVLALRDRLDPDRVFANDYLRRVLGP